MKATPTQSTRLTDLEARQAELEKRIAELERAATRQMPASWTFPALPPSDRPIWPSAEDAKCHVCGNKWKDMTHYVCNNDRCPNRVYCGDIPLRVTCGGTAGSTTAGAPFTPGTAQNHTEPTL